MGPGIFRLLRAARRPLHGCALAAATAALAPAAQAQEVATGRMAATVEQPISIVNTNAMDFGNVIPRANGGTVVMTPAANAQCSTTGQLVHTGTCRAATFEGRVSFLFTLRVQQPNGNRITLSGPGGATMRLDNFTFGPGSGLLDLGESGANHRFTILNLSGGYTFYAGGTLNVAANQAPGVYTGTFEIQLNYN